MTAYSQLPQTHSTALIGPDEIRDAIVAKVALLNSIALTVAQVEKGYRLHLEELAAAHPSTHGLALRTFCETEGLHPSAIAAEAILTRAAIIVDALADGRDYKASAPEIYCAIMTGPLTAADLGYFPALEGTQEPTGGDKADLQGELDDYIPW